MQYIKPSNKTNKTNMSSAKLPICTVCNTNHGYTQSEYLFHSYNNTISHELYPLITYAYAFNCNCNHHCAHNRCLKTKHFCPCCGKRSDNPNLMIDTDFGKKIMFVLKYFKRNPKNIKYLKWWLWLVIAIVVMMWLMIYFEFIKNHDKTSGIICGISICIIFSGAIPMVLLEYMKKNWLLD